jgi:hypothetical protein
MWAEQVRRIEEMRNSNKTFVGNLMEEDRLEDLGVDERTSLLKFNLLI